VRREASAIRVSEARAEEERKEEEEEEEKKERAATIPTSIGQKSTNAPPPAVGTKRPRSEEGAAKLSSSLQPATKVNVLEDTRGSATETKVLVPYLTPSEEALALLWCELEVLRAARVASLDRAISATATALLKRFYNGPRAARLIEYPPHEFVSAALLAAVKAEACPYTEVAPLSRRLALVDARLRGRHERLFLPPPPPQQQLTSKEGEKKDDLLQGLSSSQMSDVSEAAVEADMLRNELPLMHGIRFQLTCYHAYRPLKELLLRCISAYIENISAVTPEAALRPLECGGSDAEDALFRSAWTAFQNRAFSFADVATLTDLPLLLSPEKIACGVMMACSRKIDSSSSSSSSHLFSDPPSSHVSSSTSSSNSSQADDEDAEEGGDMGVFERAEWELFAGLRPKALEGVGEETYNKIADFIPSFLSSLTVSSASVTLQSIASSSTQVSSSSSSASSISSSSSSFLTEPFLVDEAITISNALIVAARTIGAVGASSLTSRAKPILARLQAIRDPSFLAGTEEHAAKVALVRKRRSEYKELKAVRAAAAGAAFNTIKAGNR